MENSKDTPLGPGEQEPLQYLPEIKNSQMEKKTGVELIAEERQRQIEVEKWDYSRLY